MHAQRATSTELLAEAAGRRAFAAYTQSERTEWDTTTTRVTDALFCYYDARGWLVTIDAWTGQWLSTERV